MTEIITQGPEGIGFISGGSGVSELATLDNASIKLLISELVKLDQMSNKVAAEEMEFDKDPESMSRRELEKLIGDIQKKMKKAAAELNFEAAAEYRDKMVKLKNMLRDIEE